MAGMFEPCLMPLGDQQFGSVRALERLMSEPSSADTEAVTASAHSTGIKRLPRVPRLVLAATCLAIFGSIIAVPSAAWAVPVPWKNCGTPADAISIQQLNASVWPPRAGASLTLSYKSMLAETLTKGSLEHLTTTLPSGRVSDTWLPFQPPVAVLFDEALLGRYPIQQTTALPMPAGPYSQTLTLRVPSKGPTTQQVGLDLTGFDATGRQVVCMQLVVPVK